MYTALFFLLWLHYLYSQVIMKKNPKVILLGETHVGKTSLIQVLLHGQFQDRIANTLGACYHRFDTQDSKGERITIDIWDTAGQEKFRSLLTLYYKNSDAVIIVFDLTDPHTFQTVDYWARQIEAHCDVSPCIMLVGNKFDLKEEGKGISKDQINKYVARHSKWAYMQCSAKLNWNVEQMFGRVARMVRESERERERNAQSNKMKIHPSKLRKQGDGGSSSCC